MGIAGLLLLRGDRLFDRPGTPRSVMNSRPLLHVTSMRDAEALRLIYHIASGDV